ncbi:MAG: quinone oxidoreductase [Proteobacteria bacterium]|nr:quinone oxidoreductase [Pseudomonadota bacterium]
MTKAIILRETGGPEKLLYENIEVGAPGAGEVQIRHSAIGLNFIDVYDRTGLYPLKLPAVLGREAAGVVSAVGPKVRQLAVGMRVAYALSFPGSYCELRNVPAERLVRVPDGVSDEQAAAMMLKGMTAQYLLRSTHRVKRGETVLIHAAAGGVGSIAVQWAKTLGAKVIGTVGSEAKAQIARELGCDLVIVTDNRDFTARVKEFTGNKGVTVVYDSLGKDSFCASLDCLAPLGMMVTYGNSTGPVPPFAPLELSKRGSLFLTRPALFHYVATPARLAASAKELFDVVAKGQVNIPIGQRYRLAEAAQAHRDLEARKTTGCTVLIP